MRLAVAALLLVGCGDDLGLPPHTNAWFAGPLVPGGDAVYVACGYSGDRLCAQHGDAPIAELARSEGWKLVFPGFDGHAAAVMPTIDGADVVDIDPDTDGLTVIASIAGSFHDRAFRAGDRLVVDDQAMSRGGDVYELPFDGDVLAEGVDAAYVRDDDTVWRTDGTPEGTVAIDGFSRVAGLAPLDGGAAIVGERDGDLALWRWTLDGTTALLDLDDDRPATTRVLCPGVLEVAGHLVVTDGTVAGTRRFDEPDLQLVGAAAGDADACYVISSALWRVDAGGPTQVTELPGVRLDGEAILAGGVLRFTGPDAPWISDGTAAGTHVDWELDFGPYGQAPRGYAAAGPWLYFLARFDPPPSDDGTEDERCIFTSCDYLFSLRLD